MYPMIHFLFSLLFLTAVLVSPPTYAHAQWTILQLTDNDYNDLHVKINNNGYVTWHAYYGASLGSDIFLYNGVETRQISEGDVVGSSAYNPQINDSNNVVWQGLLSGNYLQIFLYDHDTATVSQLTNNNSSSAYSPKINETGQVVWDQGALDNSEIMLYDHPDIIQLTSNASFDGQAQINDSGHVAWNGDDASEFAQLFIYQGSLPASSVAEGQFHHISNINNSGQVAWQTNEAVSSVHLYTGTEEIQLSSHYQSRNPVINNNGYVVWQEYTYNADRDWSWEIFLYDGTETRQISVNEYDDMYPHITENNHVVWQGFDGNDYEIFFYNGSAVFQLTHNDHDDLGPRINNNDEIAWRGNDGTDEEIFLARHTPLIPEEPWGMTYGGVDSESAGTVEQTVDGGYIVSASTNSFGAGGTV